MINSLSINNLRSLSDTYVDLKPITVFVGKNSSGKSSFLRTFPLLRQSIESNTIGPILWYGKYVDFGAFNEAVDRYSENKTIDFKFKLDLDSRNINGRSKHLRYNNFLENHIFSTEVIINIKEKNISRGKTGKTILNNLKIFLDNELLFLEFSDEGKITSLKVNEFSLGFNDKIEFKINDENKFLPQIISKRIVKSFINGELTNTEIWDTYEVDESLLFSLAKEMKQYFYHSTEIETIEKGLGRITLSKKENLYDVLKIRFRGLKFFEKMLEEKKDEILKKVYSYLIMINVNGILGHLNNNLMKTFQGVKYIAPLRSTAERYYRFQDLQVNEIDHEGSNLAMLLNSLTLSEKRKFEDWTFENLGFKLKVKEVGLHYSLKIQINDDDEEYNISDMGFGFSQISPIIAMLWFETVKKNQKKMINHDLIFAIEQPELHLHPKFQAKLTKLFVSIVNFAKDNDRNIKIIFETHSNTMIDKLGECIEEKLINSDDISIVSFEKETPKSKSTIKKSYFDEEGYLCNWPIGFFSGNEYAY